MKAPATLALLMVLCGASCGRTHPLRYAGDPDEAREETVDPFGRECQNEVQDFTLPRLARRDVDVLLVVDDSGSMSDDQRILASNFGAFISAFASEGVEFHLGAITTDMQATNRRGRLVAPFLTPATPNLPEAFRSMVVLGSDGSANEQGLAAARAALSDPLASNENLGFIRADADLALVVLTDENDFSPFGADQFVPFLRALKKEPATVSVVSILGLRWFYLCERTTANWEYAKVANAFGSNGLVVSCTSDYAKRMTEVSRRIVNARCLVPLRHPIEGGAPRVTVNGAASAYALWPPDPAHPNGTLEVEPCPPNGGQVQVVEPNCR